MKNLYPSINDLSRWAEHEGYFHAWDYVDTLERKRTGKNVPENERSKKIAQLFKEENPEFIEFMTQKKIQEFISNHSLHNWACDYVDFVSVKSAGKGLSHEERLQKIDELTKEQNTEFLTYLFLLNRYKKHHKSKENEKVIGWCMACIAMYLVYFLGLWIHDSTTWVLLYVPLVVAIGWLIFFFTDRKR